ncbi:MAG: isoprenylcysteine carboxylmethyltransferase family protein [Meiothermus sp.]|uniref:methyltransferase family protein n=1 Tax=Meiothermus sp. TaxID=1955249 RepID=UPI0025FF32E2|nr:isoprenylcysteine carboxylmethyltransferase family protein [Meiothermus sp.]MCS7193404.1 isoprenylcysteine carboxylmethyltransferase family protein [Meiothermus sp.]MDW8090917.1 isoprenylcysteine carboxylmethyltransferase family protein [Meiothermus sp.]MDW8482056.1 isoprenylcysteine carboxylmethyltransferase family protein [Meiothermus sp.]
MIYLLGGLRPPVAAARGPSAPGLVWAGGVMVGYSVPMGFDRGEGYVVGQLVLLALLALAWWFTPSFSPAWLAGMGWAVAWLGLLVLLLAAWQLGRNLTAWPKPRVGGHLVQEGLYQVVRHPIYFGLLLWAAGGSLAHLNPWTLLLSALLFGLLDRKAGLEEQFLEEIYPEYRAYKRRVRKLIPWVY